MRLPPPIRFTAPLLAFVFGIVATWFDYRLNLDLDQARHLAELREQADANGRRLALLAERLLAVGDREILAAYVTALAELPGLESAVVLDASGQVIAAGPMTRPKPQADSIVSSHSFRIGSTSTGKVVLDFRRTEAIAAARADAFAQLCWMSGAMTMLSFTLWAVFHFSFASRLMRLQDSVRALGDEGGRGLSLPRGADEVGQLADTFSDMAARLRQREAEQLRLEAEVLEISERERRRIGHDLHDGIGQRLTAASMAANAATAALREEVPVQAERVADIGRQLRETIAETRALSHGLAPVALAEDGLATALAALAESTSRGGVVRCVFEQKKPVRVADEAVAGHLYRIAQEAVSNALKHACASEIRLGLELRDDVLLLEVEDDGEGFEESRAGAGGIGLRVMRYRARLIGGTLEIGSAPAGGTRISCRVKSTP